MRPVTTRRTPLAVALSVVLLAAAGVAGAATVADSGSPLAAAQVSADQHRLEITNDGSAQTVYEASFDAVVGTEGFGSGDTVEGNVASGFVRGGTDTIRYTGEITGFSFEGPAPTVRVDGSVVPVAELAGDGDAGPGDDGSDQSGEESDGGGADGDGTDGDGTDDGSTSEECLPNPYDFAEEHAYTTGGYEMGMPDRFVEDVLATDGVEAFYYGYEGPQAGAAWLVATEAGAEPVVYCKANSEDTEGIILADWRYSGTYTDAYGDKDFTPAAARWTVDPTYERDMAISDQSVDWLLAQDHVQRVEKTTTCDRSGCGEDVTVYLETHPLDQDGWWKQLPDRVDGVDVNYAEA